MTTNVGRKVVSHEAPCLLLHSAYSISFFTLYEDILDFSPSHLEHLAIRPDCACL